MSRLEKRHDFQKKTIQLLRDRAGDVCSRPECRVHTAGSNTKKGKTVSIGVAAHICAASFGGARYDSDMSESERKSYENGIWLCQSCSRLIDVDETRFPVQLLRQWKIHAEEYSLTRVGQKAITQQERDNDVQRAYGKGVAAQANSFGLGTGICKVIEGYEQSFSKLDERFIISVENASASKVTHRIEPKPEHNPNLHLLVRNTNSTREKLQRLQEFGELITLNNDSFKFEGSKLFENLMNEPHSRGTLTIVGQKTKVDTYLILRSDVFGDYELANFDSAMTCGSRGFAIQGQGLSGLFTVNANITQEHGAQVNIKYSVTAWLGKRLNTLSYFPKMLKARDFLAKYPEARLVIEFYCGDNPLHLDSAKDQYENFINGFIEIITIVDHCRNIAANFPESLIFKELVISDKDYKKIKLYNRILSGHAPEPIEDGNKVCEGDFTENMETSIDYWQVAGNGVLTYEEQVNDKITNVLGNLVIAPRINIVLHRYSLASFCFLDSKSSGKVSFIITAVKGSTYKWFFDKNDKWKLQ